jgi:hypothetical protein
MAIYGIQWDANALSGTGQVQWIQFTINKFLIKDGNNIKNQLGVIGVYPPTESDFLTNGSNTIDVYLASQPNDTLDMIYLGALGSGRQFKLTVDKTKWNRFDTFDFIDS